MRAFIPSLALLLAGHAWGQEPDTDPDDKQEQADEADSSEEGPEQEPEPEEPTEELTEEVSPKEEDPTPGDEAGRDEDDGTEEREPLRPPPEDARRSGKYPFSWSLGGHAKVFAVANFPDDTFLTEPDPIASAFVDVRGKLFLKAGRLFTFRADHAITTTINRPVLGSGFPIQTGVGLTAPEALPLTWWGWRDNEASDLYVQGRTDRLYAKFSVPGFDAVIGRQPITFGAGRMFTPLDLVSPFTPATIDSEYKPGVDAVRLDTYFGSGGKITAVTSYAGLTYIYDDPVEGEKGIERFTTAIYAQGTVGVTDIGGFYGLVRGDNVIGASVVSSIGPVGIFSDAAVTIPYKDLDEKPFFRGTLGMDGKPHEKTTLSGEIYVQTWGTLDVDDRLALYASPRFARGEVWLTGVYYLGFAWMQEITPLIHFNIAAISNLTDPSVFFTPGFNFSIADNATAFFGGFFGVGKGIAEAPGQLPPVVFESEFGAYPLSLFLQVNTYF